MAQRSATQVVMTAAGAWLAYQMVLRFGGVTLTAVLVSVAGVLSVTIYSLRHERAAAARWYQRSWTRFWFAGVCRLSSQQLPNDVALDGSSSVLQLRTSEDFVWCGRKLKEVVFGHDAAIDSIIDHLETSVRLRGYRTVGQELAPLGVFLLAGANGTGKRWLATSLGQRLFRSTELLALNMTAYGDDQAAVRLFGTAQQAGVLSQSLRQQPCLTIVLENIEAAHPVVLTALQDALQHGLQTHGAGSDVSLQSTLLFLATSLAPDDGTLDRPLDRDELIEFLQQSANCPKSVLNSLTDCLHLRSLPDVEKAKVMIQLMTEECQKYGLKLEYVEPEVVLHEVDQYSPELGFEHSRLRLARWMRSLIHRATEDRLDCLVLTERLAQQAHASATTTKTIARGVA